MKTLNITLTIKANTHDSAEILGQHNLMELVRIAGMRSGSGIATCTGDTHYVSDGVYAVEATAQIDGNGDVTEIIMEAQRKWHAKPDVISSGIFVSEDQKPEPVQHAKEPETCECFECGQVMVKGYANVINRDSSEEYYLCNGCLECAIENDDVITCQCCDEYVNANDLVYNPVTCNEDLCPCCGNKIEY